MNQIIHIPSMQEYRVTAQTRGEQERTQLKRVTIPHHARLPASPRKPAVRRTRGKNVQNFQIRSTRYVKTRSTTRKRLPSLPAFPAKNERKIDIMLTPLRASEGKCDQVTINGGPGCQSRRCGSKYTAGGRQVHHAKRRTVTRAVCWLTNRSATSDGRLLRVS